MQTVFFGNETGIWSPTGLSAININNLNKNNVLNPHCEPFGPRQSFEDIPGYYIMSQPQGYVKGNTTSNLKHQYLLTQHITDTHCF